MPEGIGGLKVPEARCCHRHPGINSHNLNLNLPLFPPLQSFSKFPQFPKAKGGMARMSEWSGMNKPAERVILSCQKRKSIRTFIWCLRVRCRWRRANMSRAQKRKSAHWDEWVWVHCRVLEMRCRLFCLFITHADRVTHNAEFNEKEHLKMKNERTCSRNAFVGSPAPRHEQNMFMREQNDVWDAAHAMRAVCSKTLQQRKYVLFYEDEMISKEVRWAFAILFARTHAARQMRRKIVLSAAMSFMLDVYLCYIERRAFVCLRCQRRGGAT